MYRGAPAAELSRGARGGIASKQLRGDLDNITLKALKKNPADRYASVDQFSEDIRRYLEGLPVLAHGDAFSYVAAKFVRRNRLAAAAATLILATLIGGIITTKSRSGTCRAAFQRRSQTGARSSVRL